MKNYTVYIEQDEDGVYVGSVPSLPGCYTQGHTLEELRENLQDVVALCSRNAGDQVSKFVGLQNIEVPAV
jgi:predicted RNase H-like HicB family nuclease